jgi:hypothetical protein
VKLAVFFPASLFSAWACSYGLVDCLRRMGHEVTGCPVDPALKHLNVSLHGAKLAPIDGFVISGPEHIGAQVIAAYPGWFKDSRRPSVAWLHETVEREDYGKLDVEVIKRSADVVFCPAIQDEKYGFRYLPFGVDTNIFSPHRCGYITGVDSDQHACDCDTRKSIDAAFIGLLYPKRQAFLAELRKQGVQLVTGNVQVLELGGVNPRKTAELYAENIRKIKVFVNLPTLSQLAVTKIYEVLACGTPILTPEVDNMRNLACLSGAVTTYTSPQDCAKKLSDMLSVQTEIARNMGPAVAYDFHAKHSLQLRCEVLISALKEIGARESVLA